MFRRTISLITTMFLLTTMAATASADPAEICETQKRRAVAKYTACRYKADAKAAKKGTAPDYARCIYQLETYFGRAEVRAGDGVCKSEDDVAQVMAEVDGSIGDIYSGLGGDGYPLCGNGIIDGNDACDGAAFAGKTCVGLGYASGDLACTSDCVFDVSGCVAATCSALPATGQTTAYGPGSDGAIQAGCAQSYTDNGDGTITDNCTGLRWEKKDDSGGLHDKDNVYSWCADADSNFQCDDPGNIMDGTIQVFIDELNDVAGGGASCFAGHCDWYVPNRNELATLLDNEVFSPSINTAFNQCPGACSDVTDPACSCTASSQYWSATTFALDPTNAQGVWFSLGTMSVTTKPNALRVRAVRDGSAD